MYKIPPPELQIDFFSRLEEIRKSYLLEALQATVQSLDIAQLDRQIADYVPTRYQRALAGRSLRAELFFPVPLLLESNPRLLGYYRLLYGFSQKQFYDRQTGISRFKPMEVRGLLAAANSLEIGKLTRAMVASGVELLNSIPLDRLSLRSLDELTLLTLGPQLRGGANNRKGVTGLSEVFDAIQQIVAPSTKRTKINSIEVKNAAGRKVLIEFAPDPDIIIREQLPDSDSFRLLIAIEVKGGTDFSNIHNRIGEAEKSHQKARELGYTECWTIVNVENLDIDTAHKESPATNRFYQMSKISAGKGEDYADFRSRIIALAGLPES